MSEQHEPAHRMLPVDLDWDRWIDGLAHGELHMQRCRSCAMLRWPAREICSACGTLDAPGWESVEPTGTVVSWTVTHRPFGPGVETPYTVVLVRLAAQSDVLVPGDFGGARDGAGLTRGAAVRGRVVEARDGERVGGIIVWDLVDAAATARRADLDAQR